VEHTTAAHRAFISLPRIGRSRYNGEYPAFSLIWVAENVDCVVGAFHGEANFYSWIWDKVAYLSRSTQYSYELMGTTFMENYGYGYG